MTNIILGRLGAGMDRRADRRVHAFDVHQLDDGRRKAFCGFVAHYSVLELIPEPTGMGCELCIAEAPLEPDSAPVSWPPEDDPMSTELYAVGLRGEFVWHDVPKRPTTQLYEDREVVITECGRIAFLVFGAAPARYERCTDCPTHPEACSP